MMRTQTRNKYLACLKEMSSMFVSDPKGLCKKHKISCTFAAWLKSNNYLTNMGNGYSYCNPDELPFDKGHDSVLNEFIKYRDNYNREYKRKEVHQKITEQDAIAVLKASERYKYEIYRVEKVQL